MEIIQSKSRKNTGIELCLKTARFIGANKKIKAKESFPNSLKACFNIS